MIFVSVDSFSGSYKMMRILLFLHRIGASGFNNLTDAVMSHFISYKYNG